MKKDKNINDHIVNNNINNSDDFQMQEPLEETIEDPDKQTEHEVCDAEEISNGEKTKNDEKKESTEPSPDEIIGTLQAELEEWKGAYLRKQAEFQNYAKRKDKELDDLRAFASEKVISKLLDTADNLERAIAASEETKDFDGLLKGVDMTLTQLKGIFQSEGVEPIEAKGKYDPVFHHAVMVADDPDIEEDHIIQELQKGYTMHGKVIRPTMVKVCKRG